MKKLTYDVVLNFFSTFFPLLLVHFILYPFILNRLGTIEYGEMLIVTTYITMLASIFGNSLNNSKLLYYKKIQSHKEFNYILVISSIINIPVLLLILLISKLHLSVPDIILLVLTSEFMLFSNFASVEFRLKLDFRNIFVSSLAQIFGYLLGVIFFNLSGDWVYILLFGSLINAFYIYIKVGSTLKLARKMEHLREVFNATIKLVFSNAILNFEAYADRLIIYPLLGVEVLSIYYMSTVIGKLLAMAVGPIASVILSYLVHEPNNGIKYFKKFNRIVIVLLLIGYSIILSVNRPILQFMYPNNYIDALKIMPVTTLTSVIYVGNTLYNSFLLRYLDVKWQMYINLGYLVLYLLISITLYSFSGLEGFIFGVLIITLLKFLFIQFLVMKIYRNNVNKFSS